ncbi:hypothetical protein B0O80DRAFT_432858 [Mortierella sp. GBAus27b]|nr:hypothetical protein B0O80DRAFT_432858 [Mortierella sp. GBAus27b]
MPSRRTSPSSSSSSTQVGNLLHRFFLDDSNFTEDYSNLHLEQAIEAEAIRIRQSEQRQMELQRQREQMMMQREQMMVRQREQIARQDQLQRDQLAFIINMRHPGLFGNSSNNNNSSSSSSSGSNANNNNAPSSSSSTAATATTTAATTTLPTPAPSATTGSSSALPVPGFGTGPGTRLGSRLGSGLGLGRRPEGSSYLHPLRNYFMRTPTPPHWDDFEFDDYLNAIADFAAPARRPPPPRPRSQFQHQHQHEHHHHHHHHPTRVADPFRDRPYHPNHHHAIFRQDRLRREQQERVATPRPPPTVRQGFTKTLGGDVRIICPMCRNELGHKGGPNTTLWVVMGCGHVVCEDCVENIFISKVVIKGSRRKSTGSAKSKGKEKAKSVRFLSTSPSTTSGSPEMEDDMDVDLPEQAAGAGGGGGGGGVSSSAAGGETAGGKRGSSGSSKTAEEQPAAAEEANFKLVKKATGLCPGCHRKIKKGSIQQLYL